MLLRFSSTLINNLSHSQKFYNFILSGSMNTTVPRLLHDAGRRNVGTFAHYFRLPDPLFKELCLKVERLIKKQDTAMRPAIDVNTRVGCTLRYLATGTSMANLHYEFRLGIYKTCSCTNIATLLLC